MPTRPTTPARPAPTIPVGMEAPAEDGVEAAAADVPTASCVVAAEVVPAELVAAATVELEYMPVAFTEPPEPVPVMRGMELDATAAVVGTADPVAVRK